MAGVVRTAHDVRNEERKDFQTLNDRLAAYVEKVRRNGPGDTQAFLTNLRSVEDEVANLKRCYDDEIDNLRRQLDAANRDRNKFEGEADKMRRVASEFEDRYNAEASKNAGLLGEISRLQTRISELEQELARLQSMSRVPETQLASAKDDLRQAMARNQQLAAELDMEKATNKQLRDKLAELEQKLDFEKQVLNEQLKDANARMDKSKGVIGQLEAKAKELESASASVPGMLASMRQKTDQEIQKYKAETEAAHNKNMAALKQQIDSQTMALDQLRANLSRLQNENDALQSKIRGLEAQVRELRSQKGGLEDQLRKDRAHSLDQVRALEKRLKELQDLMFKKMQEANANRDIQCSLRNELEAYRAILNEEEKRIGCLTSPNSGTVYYTNPTSNYGMASGYQSGSATPRTGEKRYMYTDEELKNVGFTAERTASRASTGQPIRYNGITEYQDHYCGLDTYRRAQSMNESNNAFRRPGTEGLPKLTPSGGMFRNSFQKVH